jgi:PEGA domain-containing protein
MARARRLGIAAAVTALLAAGCVDRRFVIHSNVPNAQVFIDDNPVGAAPAYSSFEYYGYYTVTLVHPGYETQSQRVHVTAPWYAYPPFDFFAEVVWPFHIRDTRHYHFDLQPATKPRIEDLVNSAENLRARGLSLPQADQPAAPRAQPEALPPPTPAPESAVPPVGPAPAPGLVPSVRP